MSINPVKNIDSPKSDTPQYYVKNIDYKGDLPKYYNSDQFKWTDFLEKNYDVIKKELQDVVLGNYQHKKNINPPGYTDPGMWTNMYFYNFMWKNHETIKNFPQTYSILSQIPGIIFAGIAVLNPKAEVKSHTGETDATIRCHFGIEIPGGLPECGMRVGGEDKAWQNGRVILFTDAYTHSTWNYTDQKRVVILFDVVREKYLGREYEISCNCLASLSIKALREKYKIFKETEGAKLKILQKIFYTFWWLFLPIQRNILKSKRISP